jgi:hypothetical protein
VATAARPPSPYTPAWPARSITGGARAGSPSTTAALVDEEQEVLAARYAAGIADVDASLSRLDEAFSLWRRAEALVRWALNTVSLGAASAVLASTSDSRVEQLP